MTTAIRKLTLEEYLNYDDGTDNRYELVAGELVAVPPESPQNVQISLFLLTQFLQFVPIRQLSNKVEIVVSGSRSTTRIPDLVVLTEELASILQSATRSTITSDMPPPTLVVKLSPLAKLTQIEITVTSDRNTQLEELPNIGLSIRKSIELRC